MCGAMWVLSTRPVWRKWKSRWRTLKSVDQQVLTVSEPLVVNNKRLDQYIQASWDSILVVSKRCVQL